MSDRISTQTLAGLVYDDRYLQHNTGLETHWETNVPYPFVEPALHMSNYRLVMRTKHLIDLTGLGKDLTRIEPYPATIEDLAVYHTEEYVERVRQICAAGGGETGEGAPASPESYEVALLAAGGGMAADDSKGRVTAAYYALSAGRANVRVRLADLRRVLAAIPRPALDGALLDLATSGEAALYRLDNPAEIRAEDRDAELRTPSGEELHIIYMGGRGS